MPHSMKVKSCVRRLCSQLVASLLCVTWPSVVLPDSYPELRPVVATSKNGEYLVRVDTVSELIEVRVYAYGNDRKYVEERAIPVVGAVFPKNVFVTNQGAIVTVDSWFESGGEYAIVIYDVQGNKSKSFALRDLYSSKDLAEFSKTTSSMHWHCSIAGDVSNNSDSVRIVDKYERVLDINTRDLSVEFVHDYKIDCPYFLGDRQ